jgi:two-component system cell cycle response regulator
MGIAVRCSTIRTRREEEEMQPETQAGAPVGTASEFDDSTPPHLREARRRCRILVVDDDALVRARLATLLRASQFDVESAASGEDALRIMAATRCEVLLTDWQMPDMDGLSLCRNVRANGSDSYVYVLMLTVRDSKEDLLTGLAAGADEYVVKGAPVEEILARVEVARRITHFEHGRRTAKRENEPDSLTDALTGAHNVRYLMKYLPRELERSRRYGHALAVLSCDVDGFKEINDRHGHEAGNELLRAFVACAEGCIRKDSDWLARVSGDEFMIVLPETKVHGANRVAQKLREALAGLSIDTNAGPVNFTVSVGMTAVEPKHERDGASKLEDVLRAADRGLYASKRRGGDHATAAAVSSVITIALDAQMGSKYDIH